jgi:hypothetical protein
MSSSKTNGVPREPFIDLMNTPHAGKSLNADGLYMIKFINNYFYTKLLNLICILIFNFRRTT